MPGCSRHLEIVSDSDGVKLKKAIDQHGTDSSNLFASPSDNFTYNKIRFVVPSPPGKHCEMIRTVYPLSRFLTSPHA